MSYFRVKVCFRRDPRRTSCGEKLERGSSLFREFHRFVPQMVVRARCRRALPQVLVKIGRLRGLIYTSDKGECGCPKTYIHFMEKKPLLTCNPEGTQLYILGGRYRVTGKGIEG